MREEGTMRNFVDQFEKAATPRGLRCVWSVVKEAQGARLVARWIDPRTETAERPRCVASLEGKAQELCLGEDLELACL